MEFRLDRNIRNQDVPGCTRLPRIPWTFVAGWQRSQVTLQPTAATLQGAPAAMGSQPPGSAQDQLSRILRTLLPFQHMDKWGWPHCNVSRKISRFGSQWPSIPGYGLFLSCELSTYFNQWMMCRCVDVNLRIGNLESACDAFAQWPVVSLPHGCAKWEWSSVRKVWNFRILWVNVNCMKLSNLSFPKQFTVGVLSSFLRGVRPCVTGRVRLSGSVALFVSLHLSPFMCPSGWWCPALWVSRFIYFLSFVSLHVSFWVLVSGSLGLSLYLSPFICLPSCVLLGGGVRLSGFLPLFVSLHLSPFMCPSGWWCPAFCVSRFICLSSFVSLNVSFWVVVSGSLCLSLYSPFICLPSCVLLGGDVRLSGFLALFVSLHLSPFMCPSGWWCPASLGFSLYLSPFICLPSCVLLGGGVRLSGFLALFVSLHVSFWVVVSSSLGLSLYLSPFMCLPSCVLLGGGVRLSGFLALFVSLQLSPFMCPSGWWCPAFWVSRFICLPSFVSLNVSFWVVVSGPLGFSLYLSPFICLPSWVLLGGGVRLSGFLALFVSLHVFFWVVVSSSLGLSLYLSPFMCPSGWWCPAFWVSRFICLPSVAPMCPTGW